jgi:hypothetical protein
MKVGATEARPLKVENDKKEGRRPGVTLEIMALVPVGYPGSRNTRLPINNKLF